MEGDEARRAVAAAIEVARSSDLPVEDALVLNDSNRLVVHLVPCDVVARIVPAGYTVFDGAVGPHREVQVVHQLAAAGAPVAALAPGVGSEVFVRDGFEIELLTHHHVLPARLLPPGDYADALQRLHGAMRQLDVEAPHFTTRVADVERWVADGEATPELPDADRTLLLDTLRRLQRSVHERRAPEQLLHGEPHPWNVLDTEGGARFVDFENCVRGPVEWDLGWVPVAVSERYRRADRGLVGDCRGLVLTIVAAHCWRPVDERPGRASRAAFMDAVRGGPPWAALDAV